MNLPTFRYHPDPVRSGSVEESKKKCKCCKKARGYIYTGPAYGEDDLDDALCPWCIADGSAHRRFGVTFVDAAGFPDSIPPGVVREIVQRTPGYSSWQSEQWFTCCADAAAFLEPVGIAEIRSKYPQVEEAVRAYIARELPGADAGQMLQSLRRDSGPTAYIFQCLHCGGYKAYVDGVFAIEA